MQNAYSKFGMFLKQYKDRFWDRDPTHMNLYIHVMQGAKWGRQYSL